MGIKTISLTMSDMEVNILVDILSQARHQNQVLGQLEQTTAAERELYRQKAETCTGVIDQLA